MVAMLVPYSGHGPMTALRAAQHLILRPNRLGPNCIAWHRHQKRGVNSHEVAATRPEMGRFVASSYRFLVNRLRRSHILADTTSRW
jgi:hypothetical protein